MEKTIDQAKQTQQKNFRQSLTTPSPPDSGRNDITVATPKTLKSRGGEQLTIAEVVAELKISRSTFYYWRTLGKAPVCFKLPNGEIRVRRTELDRWLDSLEEMA